MSNIKNYVEQGGEKSVIGGELEILPGAKIKADEGATVEGFDSAEPYELPAATEEELGGVIVGSGLDVSENGTISVSPAEAVADSAATEVAELVSNYNSLLATLRAAGFIASE